MALRETSCLCANQSGVLRENLAMDGENLETERYDSGNWY